MTFSINKPVNPESRLWVQNNLKQPSLLSDASTAAFTTLELRPTSNARIWLEHTACSGEGRHTSLTCTASVSHTHTHKQILTMHARLCPSAPRFLCQWVYISCSLWMFSEQHEVQTPLTERHSDVHRHIKRFVFTLFGFTLFFVSCLFLFLSLDLSLKRKPSEKQKKDAWVGVRPNHEGNTVRGQYRAV